MLMLAQTIAALAGSQQIGPGHLEALQYRPKRLIGM